MLAVRKKVARMIYLDSVFVPFEIIKIPIFFKNHLIPVAACPG